MLIDYLELSDLHDFFNTNSIDRGLAYHQQNKVMRIRMSEDKLDATTISAQVIGRSRSLYNVNIRVTGGCYDYGIEIETITGHCSCMMRFNCKHVVAALGEAMYTRERQGQKKHKFDNPFIESWIADFEHLVQQDTQKPPERDPTYELFFQLDGIKASEDVIRVPEITFKLFRRLKSGKLGATKHCSFSSLMESNYLEPAERDLLGRLKLCHESGNHFFFMQDSVNLTGKTGDALFMECLQTGKCYVDNKDKPLVPGQPLQANFEWKIDAEGDQWLELQSKLKDPSFFPVGKLWYYDAKKEQAGIVESEINTKLLAHLLNIPYIPPEKVDSIHRALSQHKATRTLPKPRIAQDTDAVEWEPQVHLRLGSAALQYPLDDNTKNANENTGAPIAELGFLYQGTMVLRDQKESIVTSSDAKDVQKMIRNFSTEQQAVDDLKTFGLLPIADDSEILRLNPDKKGLFCFLDNPLKFWTQTLPQLREKGWLVQVDDDYEYQVAEEANDEWYADLEEDKTSDWFGLELGLLVGKHKVNVLPVINDILQQMKGKKDLDALEKEQFFTRLPDGRFLPLPGPRIKNIVQSLVELYDHQSLTLDQKLLLSKSQAARLIEIEKACGAAKLRWFGEDKMRALGKKLSQFKSIQPVSAPQSLQGELRPYQQEGLSWMQFLREYELGGVLADDMGLGKTIQALAHILLEKESGRLTQPVLVIAPTSLMYNWRTEAAKFAPSLKTLVLHGSDRKQYFDQIEAHDLVLTTYPLLARDKKALLERTFHLLILDEAQYIKNSKSLATQIVLQLKATHRLCLTGTPMENHLGELWSLYHFLMPGFLGQDKSFKKLFRTPIEKHGDNARRLVLNKRLAPFLLRRTKDKVAKELPEKIESIQCVELDQAQRDLYESIRIAMEEKVRQEVEKLGLSRSHIVILDALLKLRQVCCDPRLLKLDMPGKKEAKSAKMQWLEENLPELVAEGRSILIFSQFTEMLKLIEDAVIRLGLSYVKLTGQTRDRQTPIAAFQNKEVPIFLISLKAGGTGLNLTAADTVIHFDPWWNPAVENQATDRAHRIGQKKSVLVYKVVTQGTVEEKITQLQEKKQALAESLYSDKSTGKSKLTEKDLKVLFEPV